MKKSGRNHQKKIRAKALRSHRRTKAVAFQHSLKPGPTSTGKGNNEGKNQATAKAQCGGLSTAAAKALPPVEMTSLSFGFEEKQQK
jgi:hypothetical protein